MRKLTTLAVLLLTTWCLAAVSQETRKTDGKAAESKAVETKAESKPVAYYRLDFTVNELEDGKKVNSRSYSTVVEASGRGSHGYWKVGSRVPANAGKGEFTYIDVGVNMDMYNITEKDGLLTFEMNGDVSSIVPGEQPQQGLPPVLSLPPVLRHARFGGPTVVTPGKSTVLYSLDDVNSKHRFQIELLATKLK